LDEVHFNTNFLNITPSFVNFNALLYIAANTKNVKNNGKFLWQDSLIQAHETFCGSHSTKMLIMK